LEAADSLTFPPATITLLLAKATTTSCLATMIRSSLRRA
jgi:hypothetical protein